jgi:hypothetical protein
MSVTVFTIIIAVLALAVALFVSRSIPGVRAYFKGRGQRLVTWPRVSHSRSRNRRRQRSGAGSLFERANTAPRQMFPLARAANLRSAMPAANRRRCRRMPGLEHRRQVVRGKKCVFCLKPITLLHHIDHAPALLGPDFRTKEWTEVLPQETSGNILDPSARRLELPRRGNLPTPASRIGYRSPHRL